MMLDIEDVAQQLGCTVSGVRKIVARGEMRYFQHGKRGRLKFKQEWVDEFIAQHTVAPADKQPQRLSAKRPAKQKSPATNEAVCGFGWDLLSRSC